MCYVWHFFFLDWKAAKKLEKIEAEALEEEKELAKISPEQRALRAEKLFKINQKELMTKTSHTQNGLRTLKIQYFS